MSHCHIEDQLKKIAAAMQATPTVGITPNGKKFANVMGIDGPIEIESDTLENAVDRLVGLVKKELFDHHRASEKQASELKASLEILNTYDTRKKS